jgi:molybdenum cofactor cytidylyltransferase
MTDLAGPPVFEPVAAILLAAGASRRLGRPKQLVKIGGESLLQRTARLALGAGCTPVVVVLGSRADLLRAELAGLAVEIVVNAEWETGMASSIHCGLRALAGRGAGATMVLVCDQPMLMEGTLTSLIATHRGVGGEGAPDITASTYAGGRGVPAIFGRAGLPALMQLTGDEGARKIISDPKWKVAVMEFAGGAVDIDLPSDIALRPGSGLSE